MKKQNHIRARAVALASAFSLIAASATQAAFVPLPPGTPETPGVALDPNTAGLTGTVLATLDTNFVDNALPTPFASGVLRSFVVDRGGGLLDFYYQLVNTTAGPIEDFFRIKTTGGFNPSLILSVAQTTTLAGLVAGPGSGFVAGSYTQGAGLEDASTADSDVGTVGSVGFDFSNPPAFIGNPENVNGGETSTFLIIRTSSTSFGRGVAAISGSATAFAATFVATPAGPKICVTKEVACEFPTGCGSFSQLATGAKTADNSQCPSFCYRVRVTNCGSEALNNVTVVDNVLALAACNFPTTLAVGQTVECIIAGVPHCESVTNTVTVTGISVSSGSNVTASATAAVEVQPIDITCNLTVNGQSSTTIRCDGQAHLITNAVEICNTGALPLTGITIQAPDLVALGGDCTNVLNLRLSLLPGACTNVLICTDILTCQPTNGACAYSNHPTVTVTGVLDTNSSACSWTRNQSNQVVAVTASSSCSVTVVVVVDITPPQVACIPGVNPSAKKIPVAGKNPSSGQNPDGYYQLLAKDDCDPNPVIYLADTGSSFIAGPFASGDVIKLTQSPGKTPSQDPAPDPIVAHLHFKGDAALYAVDANGNVSEACLCLVPRPPK